MKVMRWAVWLLDESLDSVPAHHAGRWYWRGQWGCRLSLWKFWWKDESDWRRPRDGAGWIASPTLDRIEK